ncbi:hypothetical protein WJX75_003538 [Coccomyxa subellipsoidea]|uniref:Uncharacterized protein n=1 Tax=Coccomyxa subellipsoidea TaxID=248742 RepID=A0ABR2YCV2_9CHLO
MNPDDGVAGETLRGLKQSDPPVWVNGAVVGSGFSSSWNVNGQGGGSEQMTLIDPTSSQKIYLVNGCLASGQDNLVTWNVNGITSGSVNVQGAGYPKQMVCVDPTTGHTYLIVNGCLAGDAPAGGRKLAAARSSDAAIPDFTASMVAMLGGKSGGRKMLGFGDFGFFDRFGSSAAAVAAATSSGEDFFGGSSAAAAAAATSSGGGFFDGSSAAAAAASAAGGR